MIEFRSAHVEDFQRIVDLKRQVHSPHVEHAPEFYKAVDIPLHREEYETYLDPKGKQCAYVLLDENRVVAYAFVQIIEIKNHAFIHNHKQLFIDDMCVDKGLRRHGYGTRIMQEMESVAQTNGCDTIELNVWEWNREAIEFYKRNGLKFTRLRMKKDVAGAPSQQR